MRGRGNDLFAVAAGLAAAAAIGASCPQLVCGGDPVIGIGLALAVKVIHILR